MCKFIILISPFLFCKCNTTDTLGYKQAKKTFNILIKNAKKISSNSAYYNKKTIVTCDSTETMDFYYLNDKSRKLIISQIDTSLVVTGLVEIGIQNVKNKSLEYKFNTSSLTNKNAPREIIENYEIENKEFLSYKAKVRLPSGKEKIIYSFSYYERNPLLGIYISVASN